MIFDAKVEVSCDREGCVECTFVDLGYERFHSSINSAFSFV